MTTFIVSLFASIAILSRTYFRDLRYIADKIIYHKKQNFIWKFTFYNEILFLNLHSFLRHMALL